MKIVIHKKYLLILFCFWMIIQLLLLFQFGIVTNNEAVKYREEAQNFLNNEHFSEQKYIFYSAYIFLHAIFIEAGFETAGVFITQLLTNLLAMYCLYKTALNISNNNKIAFLSAFLLIICYSWQYWTVYLYTESFFCSLIIIFTFLLFGINKKTTLQYICTGLLFILILLARPTGMLFIPVICFLLLYKLILRRKFIIAFFSALFIPALFLIILNYAMKAGTSYDFMKPLIENNVLCYIPEQAIQSSAAAHTNDNGLNGIIDYFRNNPLTFLKLAALKFIAYWGFTRPYYSAFHNWWLRCFFYPIYVFAFVGIFTLKKNHEYFVFYGTGVLIIFSLSVMFTCDDWNNRFIMPIIPLVILFAAFGVYHVYIKIKKILQ